MTKRNVIANSVCCLCLLVCVAVACGEKKRAIDVGLIPFSALVADRSMAMSGASVGVDVRRH